MIRGVDGYLSGLIRLIFGYLSCTTCERGDKLCEINNARQMHVPLGLSVELLASGQRGL